MPHLLKALSFIGTVAMLWVGGGIIVHGLEAFGSSAIPHILEMLSHVTERIPGIGAVTGWLTFALGAAVVGLVIGGAIVAITHAIDRKSTRLNSSHVKISYAVF